MAARFGGQARPASRGVRADAIVRWSGEAIEGVSELMSAAIRTGRDMEETPCGELRLATVAG